MDSDNGLILYDSDKDYYKALIPNPFASCHAAELCLLPNGDMLCAWFAGSSEGLADISIVMSRLKKGEDVWSQPDKISDDPHRSEQNPSLFLTPLDLSGHSDLWCMYTAQIARDKNSAKKGLQSTAVIRRRISHDYGYTFETREDIFTEEGSFCRQRIQVLSNGRFIFGNWMCKDDGTGYGSDIAVMRISDDSGKTWQTVTVPKSRGRVHANIIEGLKKDGELIAFFRSRAADNIYIARSADFGSTWTEPVRTVLPNNNASISALRLHSGAIAIVYNAFRANDDPTLTVWPKIRCPIEVALSFDEGKTFPYRRILEPGEGFTGEDNVIKNKRYEYPVMIQDETDRIHIAYSYANRYCIKHVIINENWIKG